VAVLIPIVKHAAVPRTQLAAWLPHLVLIALAGASAAWLLVLLAPVAKALVVGASLALLTHGVLFRRISQRLAWWPWPRTRGHAAATLAVAVLLAATAGAATLVLWAALGGLRLTLGALWGVAVQDPARIRQVVDLLTARAEELLRLYPALPLSAEDARTWITDLLSQVAVGQAFLRTVVSGGGSVVVEVVLTGVVTWWLYLQGPSLGSRLLMLVPAAEREAIKTRLRERAGALVLGTFGRAFLVGVLQGVLAWLIGGFHPVLVAAVAVIAAVMPLLGPVFVWLPLASLLASQGHWGQAAALAVCSHVGAVGMGWFLDRRAAAAPLSGTGPILLLTLVGGLWGFGARALILAPAAVVLALSAWDALTSLYTDSPAAGEDEFVGHA
jgi:predicted PurR-regulated permease PerM